ncbi:hypothetical protein F5Y04DRAFT_26823 [Hypomontagnella monticulosa]|nr:hypothetical protein F5Y04DRAFT_26823 [Hypomontagnella monticulosa]
MGKPWKFGSKPIKNRPKPQPAYQPPTKFWNGPFRFFDLPPELRDVIIRLILNSCDFNLKNAVRLFLANRRIYMEAASIFYYEVLLDNMNLRDKADPFLSGPLSRVAPRQLVRNLIIRFTMKEQIYLFGECYAAVLREMTEKGNLHDLRLEIWSRFPNWEFWGFEDEAFVCDDVRIRDANGKTVVVSAPLFITRTPFQSFLTFLEESPIPRISLWIHAKDHPAFWCPFHRNLPNGEKCNGEWGGNARMLKVQTSGLIRALKGAEAVGTGKKAYPSSVQYTPLY